MAEKEPKSAMAGLDLEAVILRLHRSGIRVGLQTAAEGITVWISDQLHRVRADHVFMQPDANSGLTLESMALWLHEVAVRLFPGSPYARSAKRSGPADGADDASRDKNGPEAATPSKS
jgi:hypothetical protein